MVDIRSNNLDGVEISWFAPICNGDTDFLGTMPNQYKSNWKNTSEILLEADRLGFKNILCPSSYQVGQDTLSFASAVAPLTKNINLLPAIRCGEVYPPMLARAIATLDHILEGRLTLNIISSNLPGEQMESSSRYARSKEVIEILKQAWNQDEIDFHGDFYKINLPTLPIKPYQQNGGPLLYFGGYSDPGVDLCAEHCDVYLMWPETQRRLGQLMETMSTKASSHERKVDFGLRVHVIVRETEDEARAAAERLVSKLDVETGVSIRNRALDAKSYGVARQTHMRQQSGTDGYIEDFLWTGIGRARSGCGAALVGNPDQIVKKINEYIKMGIRSFIFSGYPHLEECRLFAEHVLPQFNLTTLSKAQKRTPDNVPMTPLANSPRV